MPVYEYTCRDCGKKSEIYLRTLNEQPKCECGSTQLEKQFSVFAVSDVSTKSGSACSDGSCSLPSSPCASGMCGL